MSTCAFCRPLHDTRRCRYRKTAEARLLGNTTLVAQIDLALQHAVVAQQPDGWQELSEAGRAIEAVVHSLESDDRLGMVYCLFAHRVQDALATVTEAEIKDRLRRTLREFGTRYSRTPSGRV
jgi:hypothetical protein